MYTVITYDISDDRARYRVVKRLKDTAQRVQLSVFESDGLNEASFLRLQSDLLGLIDPETDSLRYHRLCRACAARVVHEGKVLELVEPVLDYKVF